MNIIQSTRVVLMMVVATLASPALTNDLENCQGVSLEGKGCQTKDGDIDCGEYYMRAGCDCNCNADGSKGDGYGTMGPGTQCIDNSGACHNGGGTCADMTSHPSYGAKCDCSASSCR